MCKVDAGIKLIGWGDDGWSKVLMEEAGEYLNYIAFIICLIQVKG